MGEERRKFKRVPAGTIVWYEIDDLEKLQSGLDQSDVALHSPLESVDVSIGGVQIIADTRLEHDKRLKLILSVSSKSPPISVLARVAWARPGERPGTFNVGMEFVEFLNDRKKLLEDYIESFK